MKRDKNFKLSKQVKRHMASIVDTVKRNEYKNAMIEAQLFAARTASIKHDKKKNKEISVEE